MILKKKMSTLSNLFLPDGLISHPFFDLFCPFHPPPTPKHISFSEVHVSWRLFFFLPTLLFPQVDTFLTPDFHSPATRE